MPSNPSPPSQRAAQPKAHGASETWEVTATGCCIADARPCGSTAAIINTNATSTLDYCDEESAAVTLYFDIARHAPSTSSSEQQAVSVFLSAAG